MSCFKLLIYVAAYIIEINNQGQTEIPLVIYLYLSKYATSLKLGLG